ncbi:MAG: DUF5615 family PIN-like protein [Bacteroidetes bacterium]|nr:DUF5615 family PIN-like protein [Bacteroidota bacterium]
MKLLANENIPYPSIKYLRDKGFDILAAGLDFSGIKDSEILQLAIAQQRIIFTFDRDYGELIFRHDFKPENGVVYLRLNKYSPTDPGIIIEQLILSSIDLSRALTVVDIHGIRQRKY